MLWGHWSRAFAGQAVMPPSLIAAAIRLVLMLKVKRSSAYVCSSILMPRSMNGVNSTQNAAKSPPVDHVCLGLLPSSSSHEKKTDHASERDSDDVQAQRRLHQETIRGLDAEAGMFLDETGVHSAMARHDARPPQGERVHTSTPVNKGNNMTVLGAYRSRGSWLR